MILGAVQPFIVPKADAWISETPIFVLKDTFTVGGRSFLQSGCILGFEAQGFLQGLQITGI